MATTKKKAPTRQPAPGDATPQVHTEEYEALVGRFAGAVDCMHRKEWPVARDQFAQLVTDNPDEPSLIERARTYVRICEQRLASEPIGPKTTEERYAHAVYLSNAGQWDEAIRLLDQNIADTPSSARDLYARAGAWAQKVVTDKAVADLRLAIAAEPQAKFHALNDPDFESIREEPSFIDLVEPTPTGA